MKRLVILFIMICTFTTSAAYAAGVSKKSSTSSISVEMETKDHFMLTGRLSYPDTKLKKYPLVVLLHSLGYSSQYWLGMESNLRKAGFAVLAIDFRGHGKSIYDADFKKSNWIYMPDSSFAKYPQDVLDMLVYVNDNYKNISVTNIAFIGADIGANTAIMVASKLKTKPVAIALISPTTKFKGIYTPVTLAEIGSIPILMTYSDKDRYSKDQTNYLKKFVQGSHTVKSYPYGGLGMLMLKVNEGMDVDIVNWIVREFNEAHEQKSN